MKTMNASDYAIEQIRNSKNKNHWRVRAFKKQVEEEVSKYRLTAIKHTGTYLGNLCAKEASRLERELTLAIFGIR